MADDVDLTIIRMLVEHFSGSKLIEPITSKPDWQTVAREILRTRDRVHALAGFEGRLWILPSSQEVSMISMQEEIRCNRSGIEIRDPRVKQRCLSNSVPVESFSLKPNKSPSAPLLLHVGPFHKSTSNRRHTRQGDRKIPGLHKTLVESQQHALQLRTSDVGLQVV